MHDASRETQEIPLRVSLSLVRDPYPLGHVEPPMGALSGYPDWMVERNISPNTSRQRMNFARRLEREWGTFDVSPRVAIEWLNGYSGWTWQTYVSHVHAVYEFLIDTGVVETSPLEKLRRPPTPRPRPRPLSERDRDRVLTSCDGDLLSWCLLAYLAGLRVHEVAKFRGEDITKSTIEVLGKGKKLAHIPTHPDLWRLAESYPRHGFWFPSIRGAHLKADAITTRVTAYFRGLGIEEGSLHRLRHTFATDMARQGVGPRVIQELMRHSSLETTMRYIEAAADEKRSAVELLSRPSAA